MARTRTRRAFFVLRCFDLYSRTAASWTPRYNRWAMVDSKCFAHLSALRTPRDLRSLWLWKIRLVTCAGDARPLPCRTDSVARETGLRCAGSVFSVSMHLPASTRTDAGGKCRRKPEAALSIGQPPVTSVWPGIHRRLARTGWSRRGILAAFVG